MTRRSGQWQLVGHGSDPVPADEWDVRGVARDYGRRGDELEDAQGVLDRLSRLDGWTGDAAESFATKSQEVTADLGKAARKYHDAARALESYAGAVSTARTRTWTSLQKAESADATVRANPRSSSFPLLGGTDPFTFGVTPEEADQQRQQNKRHDAAVAELSDAREEVRLAMEALESAARNAADRIRDASDLFKDSHWDNFKGFVRRHADILAKIASVLEVVAMVVGAIAIVVALIATAPAWLVAGLFIASMALGVAMLGIHSALWSAGTGKAGAADVALDIVNLATLGMGAKLASLGRAAYGAATSAATRNAVAASQRGLASNTRNALRISNPANPLRRWATRQADDAAAVARSTITQLETLAVPVRNRVAALDYNAAKMVLQIRELRLLDETAEVARHLDQAAHYNRWQVRTLRVDFANNFVQSLDRYTGEHVVKPAKDWVNETVDDAVDTGQDTISELRWRYTVAGR